MDRRRSFQLAVLHIRARSPAISIFLVARENNPAFLLHRPETISIDPTSPFHLSIPFRLELRHLHRARTDARVKLRVDILRVPLFFCIRLNEFL